MALAKNIISNPRFFSTSCICMTRENPGVKKTREVFDERFPITGKHVNQKRKGGSKEMSEKLAKHVVQEPGYVDRRNYLYRTKKEMIPEFIVPDLTDFKLKPYVPYNVAEIEDKPEEVTPELLFKKFYADKVQDDFNEGKVTPDMDLEHFEKLESLKS